jgi:DNA-binding transcriptional LysR family regulator
MLNSMKLSIGDLEAAVKVTEYGHFTRAGEKINRSQTSVSKGVRRVEQTLEAELLDRKARPAAPTRSGEIFSYQMRKALYFMERGIAGAKRAAHSDGGTLHVGHTSYFDLDLLTSLWNIGRQPSARFSAVFHSSSTAEVIANVSTGIWDCGFVVSHADLRGLRCVSIADDPLGIVMEKGHRLARKRSLRIEDIQNEPMILPSKERNPGFRTWFLGQCAAAHIKPHIVQEVSNPHEGSVLASQNVGIALTVASSAKHLPKGTPLVFRPFVGGVLDSEMQLVFPKGLRSPAVLTFVRVATRMVRRMPVASVGRESLSVRAAS